MMPGTKGSFAFHAPRPGPPGGGNAYAEGLAAALRALGHEVTDGSGPGMPVVDGIALPALEPGIDALLDRGAVALVHHLGAAAGRDPAARDAVRGAEKRLLPRFRRVIAGSEPVAERLRAELGVVDPVVLQPGEPERPRSADGRFVLSPGVLTPRKNHLGLLGAMARLSDLDWHLVIAGDPSRDPDTARAVAARVAAPELRDRATLLPDGSPERLEPFWAEAGLFATASRWEGYPAAAAEALRRGVPVVAPRSPGFEALVPPEAGILFLPDDAATFGKCLRRVIFDRALRAELAQGAWEAGRVLPSWGEQAARFMAVVEGG